MTKTPRIILNKVSFQLPKSTVKFSDVNLSLESYCYGIIGNNGVGKTTFLKLLSGALEPDSGTIQRHGTIVESPQSHHHIDMSASIADVLGVTPVLEALQRIHSGDTDNTNYDIVDDQWNIEKRIAQSLQKFNIAQLNLDHKFHQLSGGQKTHVLLAKTILFGADFFLFDEPTNNLDHESRSVLYQHLQQSPKGKIIVSHDRELLNICHYIIEITTKGINLYGGNFDFYEKQKATEKNALNKEIQSRTEKLAKSKKVIQSRIEKHQKSTSRGKKQIKQQIKDTGSYNKMEMKAKKAKSQATNRRILLQAEKKLTTISKELSTSIEKLETPKQLNINLNNTTIPSNKLVIKVTDLCFCYNKLKKILNNVSLCLIGPERVAITGPNGCGKSTLIKLIRKQLEPSKGEIIIGVNNVAYLDQSVSFLFADKSIKDNFLLLNPDAQLFDAYSALAAFKFRNAEAEKIVNQLSGGEKIRAGLAVTLMSKKPPQLIILDEPTNHLDIKTIKAIEEALTIYQGAILAVSHDHRFLENIGIKRTIKL